MPVGYRNSAGVEFDDLFEPGNSQAPGFRKSDGTNLRFEPRGATPKIPDVGFRDSLGSDLSNQWMKRAVAPPVPGFNGQTYTCSAQALTGSSGQSSAHLTLNMKSDGTWEVLGSIVNGSGSGSGVLASGTWLPPGTLASQFTVQFAATAGTGQGTIINSAPSAANLSVTQSFQFSVQVNAASANTREDSRTLVTTLTRIGAGSAVASTNLNVSVTGWL